MRLRPAQGRREMERGHNTVIEEVSCTLAGLALLRLRKCAVVYEANEHLVSSPSGGRSRSRNGVFFAVVSLSIRRARCCPTIGSRQANKVAIQLGEDEVCLRLWGLVHVRARNEWACQLQVSDYSAESYAVHMYMSHPAS